MMNKEKNFISAVLYVHNAEKRLESFLPMIINVLESNFEHSEIICVNDFSEDGSLDVIEKISKLAKSTSISVVNLSNFHGLELAMNAGVDLTIGDFVFEFDNTNLDFAPLLIMDVYRRSLEGYDNVSASPDKKEKITSRFFYHIFDVCSNNVYKMSTESFRILSRRAINRVNSMNKTVPYRKVLYVNCGLKIDSLKYTVTENVKEKLDKKERKYRSELAVDSLILFTELGYRFSMIMTAALMIISIFMIVYSLSSYFLINPIEGWTTTILFLSIAFFGLFGILTVIMKYLQLLLNMVFKRKYYTYESIEKFTK